MSLPDLERLMPLGLGTAGIGNHRVARTDAEAMALLQAAWDGGVRHFDTAPHYGLGLAEERLGRFLADKPRDSYVISTKVGRVLEPHPNPRRLLDDEGFVVPADSVRRWDFSPAGVRRSLDGSLARLGLDRVDIAYLHDPERWDLSTALDEGLGALADLKARRYVGAVGVASMDIAALATATERTDVDVVMAAGRQTLATPDLDRGVLAACEERGLSVIAAAVFNGGLLATPRAPGSTFDYGATPAAMRDRVARIERVCAEAGVELRVAALHFPLRRPAVVSLVVGGDTPAQVARNVADLRTPVPDRLWAALTAAGLLAP